MEMALDIQALQEGREPWSKAKQPDSGGGALQAANESGRLSTLLPLEMAANRASNRRTLTEPHSAAERLLAFMRKKSFASDRSAALCGSVKVRRLEARFAAISSGSRVESLPLSL